MATFYAGTAGADVYEVTMPVMPGDVFNGLGGTDTLVLATLGSTSDFRSATLRNFEILDLNSVEGGFRQALVTGQQAYQFNTLVGDAGTDRLVIFVDPGSTYQVKAYDLIDFGPFNPAGPSDAITLVTGGFIDTTLIARNDLDVLQILFGSFGNDTLIGSNGYDVLTGGDGTDTISAGAGNDTIQIVQSVSAPINIEQTSDIIDGGQGYDRLLIVGTFFVGEVTNVEQVDLIPTQDFGNPGVIFTDDRLTGNLFVDGDFTGEGYVSVNVLSGTIDASGVTSSTGSVRFTYEGTQADDSITGTDFDDTLVSGGGFDVLTGGLGNDSYFLLNGGDGVITELADEGYDTVLTDMSYTLGANLESLIVSPFSDAPIRAVGNSLDNYIVSGNEAEALDLILIGRGGNDYLTGGAGRDTLNGGTGADYMDGRENSDRYVVDNEGDFVFDTGSFGVDEVTASVNYQAGVGIERLRLIGEALNGFGNELDNTIRGSALDNVLAGLDGNDVLLGYAGRDDLNGGFGNDILVGGAAQDFMTGGAGADRFVFADGDFFGLDLRGADRIRDFSQAEGDRIDLRGVDAVTGGEDDGFAFVGNAAFSGTAGELRYEQIEGSTMIYGDTDGDGTADFAIRVLGTFDLQANDFIL